jgi:hypothetical protein
MTPFLTSLLLNNIGYLAETLQADMILDGTYVPLPGLDKHTLELIQELQQPESIRETGDLNISFTPKEHK